MSSAGCCRDIIADVNSHIVSEPPKIEVGRLERSVVADGDRQVWAHVDAAALSGLATEPLPGVAASEKMERLPLMHAEIGVLSGGLRHGGPHLRALRQVGAHGAADGREDALQLVQRHWDGVPDLPAAAAHTHCRPVLQSYRHGLEAQLLGMYSP